MHPNSVVYLTYNVESERKFQMILMEDIIREGHPTLRTRAEEVTFPLIRRRSSISTRYATVFNK